MGRCIPAEGHRHGRKKIGRPFTASQKRKAVGKWAHYPPTDSGKSKTFPVGLLSCASEGTPLPSAALPSQFPNDRLSPTDSSLSAHSDGHPRSPAAPPGYESPFPCLHTRLAKPSAVAATQSLRTKQYAIPGAPWQSIPCRIYYRISFVLCQDFFRSECTNFWHSVPTQSSAPPAGRQAGRSSPSKNPYFQQAKAGVLLQYGQ